MHLIWSQLQSTWRLFTYLVYTFFVALWPYAIFSYMYESVPLMSTPFASYMWRNPRFGLLNTGVVKCHAPISVIGNARTVVGSALTSPLTCLPLSSFAPMWYNNAHKSNIKLMGSFYWTPPFQMLKVLIRLQWVVYFALAQDCKNSKIRDIRYSLVSERILKDPLGRYMRYVFPLNNVARQVFILVQVHVYK